jgi:hypothetical protein
MKQLYRGVKKEFIEGVRSQKKGKSREVIFTDEQWARMPQVVKMAMVETAYGVGLSKKGYYGMKRLHG